MSRLARGILPLATVVLLVSSVPLAFPSNNPASANVASVGPPCPGPAREALVETPVDELERIRGHYAAEPGFVDAYAFPGPPARIVVLFDAGARSGALPAAVPAPSGWELAVLAQTFEPLIAPPEGPYFDPPLIPLSCPTLIYPGQRVTTPVGGCSANFIYRDQTGLFYVGTAGHCFSQLGQRLTVPGIGQVGTVIYRISNGVGNDFALVRIDPEDQVRVRPAMCHWGGPTGVAGFTSGFVRHYGFPVIYDLTPQTRPRTGSGGANTLTSFSFAGTVASGDSGSGARANDGLALGLITHVNFGLILFAHSAPTAFGTHVQRAMSLAEAGTGLDLTLVTAPLP